MFSPGGGIAFSRLDAPSQRFKGLCWHLHQQLSTTNSCTLRLRGFSTSVRTSAGSAVSQGPLPLARSPGSHLLQPCGLWGLVDLLNLGGNEPSLSEPSVGAGQRQISGFVSMFRKSHSWKRNPASRLPAVSEPPAPGPGGMFRNQDLGLHLSAFSAASVDASMLGGAHREQHVLGYLCLYCALCSGQIWGLGPLYCALCSGQIWGLRPKEHPEVPAESSLGWACNCRRQSSPMSPADLGDR